MKKFKYFLILSLLVLFFGTIANAQEGWKPYVTNSGGDLITVFFTSSDNGWIAGDDGFLAITNDGGKTWTRQNLNVSDNINEIYFRNNDNGYLVAGRVMFKTKNGGKTWEEFVPLEKRNFGGGTPEFLSIRFTGKKDGFIIGSVLKEVGEEVRVIDSLVLKTSDGGETWRRITVPFDKEIYNLDFVNDDYGWLVGDDGMILATNNGGLTWQIQRTPLRPIEGKKNKPALYSVDFRDKKEGYAVGGYGTILRTDNGGETWAVVKTAYPETFLRVDFANNENGWIVGREGTILRSSDKGRSWLKQDSKTDKHLYGLFMTKKYGWAVGQKGAILKYDR